MSQLLQNRWHLRRVADASAKSCMICYKPSSSVLVTPDNKDFFYICTAHLKDRGFCSPIVDEEEVAAKKKKEELDREIEKVKKEYEEKQRKKKEKAKEKEKGKEKDEEKSDDKKDDKKENADDEESKKDEMEKNDKIKSIQEAAAGNTGTDESPRIFSLHKNFFQARIDRLRAIEKAKKDRQRLQNPSTFPSVPKSDLK